MRRFVVDARVGVWDAELQNVQRTTCPEGNHDRETASARAAGCSHGLAVLKASTTAATAGLFDILRQKIGDDLRR